MVPRNNPRVNWPRKGYGYCLDSMGIVCSTICHLKAYWAQEIQCAEDRSVYPNGTRPRKKRYKERLVSLVTLSRTSKVHLAGTLLASSVPHFLPLDNSASWQHSLYSCSISFFPAKPYFNPFGDFGKLLSGAFRHRQPTSLLFDMEKIVNK